MRLLAVDIGNSAVKCAPFDGHAHGSVTSRRHEGSKSVVVGQVLSAVRAGPPEKVLVGGVVPEHLNALMQALEREGIPALRFRSDFQPLVEIGTSTPEGSGDDRVAAASAAFGLTGGAAVVVSAGTAVTVDSVEPGGVFLGGAILPGPELALSALSSGTVLLPPVRPVTPVSAIGKDTVQAMLSGCVIGVAGAIDRLVSVVRREMKHPECEVILTGGSADLLYDHLQTACRREPALVLQGLVVSYLGRGAP